SSERHDMSRVPYGPPIHEAIGRGDLAEMKTLVSEGERFLQEHGDVRSSLEVLKAEVARREAQAADRAAPSSMPPYGPPIQQAIARGDLAEMKALLTRAETIPPKQGDLATAVAQLKAEIAKRSK